MSEHALKLLILDLQNVTNLLVNYTISVLLDKRFSVVRTK